MLRYAFLLFWLFIISLSSCSEDGLHFQESRPVDELGWKYEDVKSFNFTIADTISRFDLVLDLTHKTDYAFQNAYVAVHTSFPSGKTISDKISLELAAGTGVWLGACSGNECTISILLQERVKFPEQGNYKIEFEQFNRSENMKSISNLAFKIYNSSL